MLIPPFIQPFLIFESDALQRKTALGQLPVACYPTSIEKPLSVACTAAAHPTSPGSQLDDLELSILESFLSPLKSCRSPRLSHLDRSPGFSPAQSLSPLQGVNNLAHAFEQAGQLIDIYICVCVCVLQPYFQIECANPALVVWQACMAFMHVGHLTEPPPPPPPGGKIKGPSDSDMQGYQIPLSPVDMAPKRRRY